MRLPAASIGRHTRRLDALAVTVMALLATVSFSRSLVRELGKSSGSATAQVVVAPRVTDAVVQQPFAIDPPAPSEPPAKRTVHARAAGAPTPPEELATTPLPTETPAAEDQGAPTAATAEAAAAAVPEDPLPAAGAEEPVG